ncbi:hypothetical protein S40288_02839 [Stachybotrys chartarum IBT 40288]|nr:hypothetical protein S40288_02839 [Stachybotrys chartarum IBT 40288]
MAIPMQRLGGRALRTGDDDDAEREYDRLRDLARAEAERRNDCFERSRQAYNDGDGAGAKELSNQGKAHDRKMDDYNRQASEFIFRENNAPGRVEADCVDLHGQFVEEAERILEQRIREDQARGQTHLHVIVGKGNHSTGHVQKLKPKVEQLCNELGLRYRTEENAGRIYINLQGGEPLGPGDGGHGHDDGYGGGGGYPGQHGGQQQHHGGQQHHQQPQHGDDMAEVVAKQLPWLLRKLEKHCCAVILDSLMPLIIVTGLPTSGKSTRAQQLYDYLTQRIVDSKYRLHLISDDSLSISRSVYDLSELPAHVRSANASEKNARASLYAAVKRVLSDKDIVILDGLNYIKGWRYQLHCESKAVRTPSCILQVGCSVDRARQVNQKRLQTTGDAQHNDDGTTTAPAEITEPYAAGNWDNLAFRYEEPNPMTRWDSPLFTLIWEDDEDQTKKVFDDLWEAIAGEGRKAVRPNQATVQRSRDTSGDYLYILDRETQDIVKRILEQQGEEGGAEVKVPLSSKGGDNLIVELPPGRKVNLPQLQRLRRAFVGLHRGGIGLEAVGNMAADRLREAFVRYLNDTFEQDE